jgi:hypothetical protein
MAHLIEKPFDRILSTLGKEWHGMAEQVDCISEEAASPLFFPIVEGVPTLRLEGEETRLEDWKIVAADLRGREDIPAGERIRPLHVPKASYEVIDNRTVWDGMTRALDGIDATVSTVGTLGGCKRFFISVSLNSHSEIVLPRGEKCLAFLNFITSHDGTLAMEAFDSTVRIVCNNTLQWSLEAAGKVGFKMFHTAGSAARVANMSDLICEILAGRQNFAETMQSLASQTVSQESAEKIVAGYFAIGQELKPDVALATRSKNAVEEIVRLSYKGRGNVGGNLYDLLNGATEYWSEGDGSGKGTARDKGRKVYSANFGRAMEHKRNFAAMISHGGTLQKMRIAGGKALSAMDRPRVVSMSLASTPGASEDTSEDIAPLVVIGG